MMGTGTTQRRALATVVVLAVALCGAATLRAAVGWEVATGAPQVQASAGGSLSLTDSDQEGAIFDLANMGPGETGQGEVTISNTGTMPGALSLGSIGLTDSPGRYGGTLSERLLLQLENVSSGTASAVYSGQLGAMPELDLGVLAAGGSRTYRFLVTMLDGGAPSSPFVDDNVYQRATTGIGYRWTLAEIEAGPEPDPVSGPSPTPLPSSPVVPASPAEPRVLTATPRADTLVGSPRDDVIRGLGGADRIYGRGGRDLLVGGAGADRLYGGGGADRLLGGAGPDRIFARGGGGDAIDCGDGVDTANVDAGDRVRNCERLRLPTQN
jgi:Ca2+-binding RTX toxin-like protein